MKPMQNGRSSISAEEREVCAAMFDLVAALVSDGVLTTGQVMDAVATNLEYADVKLPPGAEHDATETNPEWVDVERRRIALLRGLAPQAYADAAAEFGVRLALEGTYNRKWADPKPEGV